ncbi:MAG: hypothetical protein JNK87_24540 [Bryobacterales bacterium]|nr:hypothetical protein [Bryobacterales bacterium]
MAILAGCTGQLRAEGCLLAAGQSSGSLGGFSPTTGNVRLDSAFTREYQLLSQVMGVRPGLFILDDRNGSNAYATPQSVNGLTDGTVLFGYRLLTEEWNTSKGFNFSIPAILAHEFGHITQFRFGARMPGKVTELQADFIAGWYMGNRDMLSGYSRAALEQGARAFFSKGDYQFNEEGHHGTPQERMNAFLRGFQLQGVNFTVAFRASQDFARTVPAPGADASRPDASGYKGSPSRAAGPADVRLMQRLVRDAKSSFASARGSMTESDGSRRTYDKAEKLPGARFCYVELQRGDPGDNYRESAEYVCHFPETFDRDRLEENAKEAFADWQWRTGNRNRLFGAPPGDHQDLDVPLISINTVEGKQRTFHVFRISYYRRR